MTGLGIPGWRPFAAAATAAALVSIAFVLWTANRWVSDQATIGLDDIGEAVAAFIAAGSCAFAAVRSGGRVRVAWTLFSLSALSWALGEVVWSWIEVVEGQGVPFPSAADAGYLLAIPLAIAGVFAFTSSPRRLATRGEAVLAGAIVALSLLFLAWGFGLAKVYETSSATPAQGFAIEDKVISLEQAVRSSSGLPADILKLPERGYLKKGYFADVVVFDPATYRDKATFEQPHQYATGVRYLFVNGRLVIDQGEFQNVLAGRVLRHKK